MWQCRKCSKPVYFAERKQSLGFDWHPNCLRCEECGKRLNPGQHAEHKGVPFCHHPCYGALFGPQLFGHGTRNECHTSFGKIENRDGKIKRTHLEAKLKSYNSIYDGKPGELKCREVNGRLILEGVLRIYWGVKHTIHLKEEDDSRMIVNRRQMSLPPSKLDQPCYTDSDEEADGSAWKSEYTNVNSENSSKLSTHQYAEDISPLSDESPTYPINPHSNNIVNSSLNNETTSQGSEEPLIRLDSSQSDNVLPCNQYSNSSEYANLDLSAGSEFCTPLYNSDTLESRTSISYNLDSATLTSSMTSDICENSTSSSNFDCVTPTNSTSLQNSSSKPLLSTSTEEYASAKEDHTPSDHSDPTSSPYTDSSEPLTSSFSDHSEPVTPVAEENKVAVVEENPVPNQSTSLKFMKNDENDLKRSSIEFSLMDHDGNSLSHTLPAPHRRSTNGDEAAQSSSSSSYYSVDSHLNTKRENYSCERENPRPLKIGSTAIRRRPGRRMDKSRLKRRCSINGHYYLRETSSFTPPYGSPCSIWITSKTTAEEVLNMLLEKYKVEMSTFNFALFIVKDTGELRRIREDESPLISRVMLGPHEDVSKVFIMDAQRTQEVSHEVAQFLNLSMAECRAILAKYEQEEANQVNAIKKKYDDMRYIIQRRIDERKIAID